MISFRVKTICIALGFLFAHTPTIANDFGGRVSVVSQYSDNAEKRSDEEISERQDKYAIGLYGDYENALVTLDANYVGSSHRYAKDSQEDRNLLEGESSLRLGKDHNLVDVVLMHSRRGILGAPDAVDLLSNYEERQIYSVVPTLRAAITAVDSLMLQGNYAQADYRYSDFRNSTSEGASLIWQHRFSTIDIVDISANHASISFDDLPDRDYEYQSAALTYATRLRHLSYKVTGGYNRSLPEVGEEHSSPLFAFEGSYLGGINNFTLYASQKITDTSMGDGNRQSLDVDFVSRDTSGTGIDQIERKSIELRWQSQMLCDRCDLYANVFARDDDYLNLEEDNNQRGAGAGISYRLSSAAKIGLRFSRRTQRFDNEAEREEYTLDQAYLSYSYDFVNNFSLGVFAEYRERKAESSVTDYQEGIGGLSVTYNF